MPGLHNINVLVTRPSSPQADALCQGIRQLGGNPIHFPTIAFAPPTDEELFKQSIKKLGEQDWLIFISPQAVYSSVPEIRKHWPHFPDTVHFAAMGEGTASALKQAGYNAVLFPERQQNSEAFLDLPDFQQVKTKKIAIIRGEGGREMLDKTLAERGAKVLSILAYKRILPDINPDDCLKKITQHEIDIIIGASFEAVKNLKILIGEKGWSFLREIPTIVMSERIKILAEDLGFRRIWVTHQANEKAMLETMVEIRKTQYDRNSQPT